MLVDAINHRMPKGADGDDRAGPFSSAAPEHASGSDISVASKASRCWWRFGRLADGTPLKGATVDVWQADDAGYYTSSDRGRTASSLLRARFRTDAGVGSPPSRSCRFYPIPDDGPVGEMLGALGHIRPSGAYPFHDRGRWLRTLIHAHLNAEARIWIRRRVWCEEFADCHFGKTARTGSGRVSAIAFGLKPLSQATQRNGESQAAAR